MGGGATVAVWTVTDIGRVPETRGKPQYGRPTLGGSLRGHVDTDTLCNVEDIGRTTETRRNPQYGRTTPGGQVY